jgi:drug/metabolite transporter (DMT)-like permease
MIRLEQKPTASRIAFILGIGLIAVSFAAVLVRLARESSESNHVLIGVFIAFARVAFASCVAVPLGLQAMNREKPSRAAKTLAVYAGIALALHFTFWITSLSFTSIAASTTIATTSPIWLSIWAWLVWKQPPSSRVQFGIGLAFLGGIVIAFGDVQSVIAPNPTIGNFLSLLGALAGTAYFLLSQAAQKNGLSIVAFAGIAYGTAAVVLLPAPMIFGVSYTNYPINTYFWLILLGLIPQLIGHTSINWAVKFVAPTTVATVVLLEPIGSAFLAILIFQEIPSLMIILGALIIISGVFVAISQKSSKLE